MVTDAEIAAWHDCAVACASELHREEPPPPVAFLADRAGNPGTHRPLHFFFAWDDERTRVLGSAEAHWQDGAELHRVHTYVEVDPAARRAGVGRALVQAVGDAAVAGGRTALLGSAPYVGPGIDFARA